MPKLVFDEKEIKEYGQSMVNSHGAASISRKHKGKKIIWIIPNEMEPAQSSINQLVACAYLRNTVSLQHRTIHEFAQFIDDVMSNKAGFENYKFDWNAHDAIPTWINKFHAYCKKEYEE